LFGLTFLLFFSIITLFYFLTSFGQPISAYFEALGSLWFMALFIPLFNSAIHTYATRLHTLTISEINDPAYVANWAVELLEKNTVKLEQESASEKVLMPTGRYARFFNRFFNTEVVSINTEPGQVHITGLYKYVDILDARIKFGKVNFGQHAAS